MNRASQMNTRVWFRILTTVLFYALSGAGWAQEGRPTEVNPLEAGAVSTISAEESEQRLQDAMVLFERGKTDAAIYMLQQVEKADPTNYKVLFKLGEMAIGAKNWAYSIEVLRKASYLRPEDIEVRLILMDIYKAYQMPIQEIIVGKEIIAIDPNHVVATRRLAELYHEQAMQDDEIKMRQRLKQLAPDDYANTKRLAVILDENAQLWESARVYEQIRKYHPNKLDDMQRLAAIYDTLGESFREAEVLDDIAANGGGRSWLQSNAENNLRQENNIYDPFSAAVLFKYEQEPTLDILTVQPQASYTRLRVRSSIDFGVKARFQHINHQGVAPLLGGEMDINSTAVEFSAIQNWSGQDYVLAASAGFLHDDVSGRLIAGVDSNGNPVTAADFPFLADPTFNSYGGTIPIGSVQFTARPGLNMTYSAIYQHKLVDDTSARLRLFYQDRLTLAAAYEGNDRTLLKLQIDNSFISDGNYRLHGTAAGYYNIWAEEPMFDYRGRREGYFRQPPASFVRLGYEFEYFRDGGSAQDGTYQTFPRPEYRHRGMLIGQALVHQISLDEQLLFNVKFTYGAGRTLTYLRGADVRLFYFKPESENEFGIRYGFVDEDSTNQPSNNLQIGGRYKIHTASLYIKWRF